MAKTPQHSPQWKLGFFLPFLATDLLLAANYRFRLGFIRDYPGPALVFALALTVYYAFRHGIVLPSASPAAVEPDRGDDTDPHGRGTASPRPPADA